MALEDILSRLENQCEETIRTLRSQSEEQISRIQTEAEVQSQAIRRGFMGTAQTRASVERGQRLNRARLEAQQIRLDARNELIDAVFDAAREQVARTRQRTDYQTLLALLVQEVIAELGAPLHLEVDRQDLEAVRLQLDHPDSQVTVEATIECWGGVVGHTPDGRISVDNRLETRFRQAQERFSGEVAELLEREMSRGR